MRDVLKPCPFCGSDGIIRHDIATGLYGVCCTQCHGEISCVYRDEEHAREVWDHRCPEDAFIHNLICKLQDEPIPEPFLDRIEVVGPRSDWKMGWEEGIIRAMDIVKSERRAVTGEYRQRGVK